MKKILLTVPVIGLLAACNVQNQPALTGAAVGAATGVALSGDDDRAAGALLGGAIGAAAGNYIGRANQPGQCIYQYPSGQTYTAAC